MELLGEVREGEEARGTKKKKRKGEKGEREKSQGKGERGENSLASLVLSSISLLSLPYTHSTTITDLVWIFDLFVSLVSSRLTHPQEEEQQVTGTTQHGNILSVFLLSPFLFIISTSLPPPSLPHTDYAVHIFHEAVKYGRYTCFLHEDTRLPMIYLPDCVKATIMCLEAPAKQIRDSMR